VGGGDLRPLQINRMSSEVKLEGGFEFTAVDPLLLSFTSSKSLYQCHEGLWRCPRGGAFVSRRSLILALLTRRPLRKRVGSGGEVSVCYPRGDRTGRRCPLAAYRPGATLREGVSRIGASNLVGVASKVGTAIKNYLSSMNL